MERRLGAVALAGGSWIVLIASVVGGRAAEWVFALTVVAFPLLLIDFAAGRTRGVRSVLAGLGLLFVLSTVGLLGLPPATAGSRPLLGLPPSSWLMLGGLGLAPLLLVVVAFARSFDRGSGGRT